MSAAQSTLVLLLALIGTTTCLGQDGTLSLSSGSAAPGASVTLNVSLNSSTTPPASLEWTLSYSTVDFSSVTIAAGPVAMGANKSVSCATGDGKSRCIVSGLNDATIPNGVVATMSLTVSTSTTDTSSPLQFASDVGAATGATSLAIASSGGVVTIVPALNGFSCTPLAVNPSTGSTCTVALTAAAGSGGAAISLGSSPADVAIPSTMTIPQGSTSTTFSVTAGGVTTPTLVTLTASYSGASETFGLTVNPSGAALSSLSVSPSTIVSGQSGTGTVTLTAAAPSGGAVVSLSSPNAAASVPASVTVPQGATSATFSVTTGTVNTATSITLTASFNGLSQTTGITVNPVAATLASISVSPSTIVSGQSGTGTVTLTAAAPSGGAVVSLSSPNVAVSVPASVAVPHGATSATFSVTTGTVTTSTAVTLTAFYSGGTATFGLTVNPLAAAALSSLSVGSSMIVGQSGSGTVTLTSAAPSGGAVVTLSSSNSSAASVPASVTVAQGASSTTFPVTAGGVTVATYVTLTAAYAGVSKTVGLTVNATPAAAGISYVQGNYATPQTPQTQVSVKFPAAQAPGDVNVVVVGWNDSTAVVNAVTDSSGNTYSLAVGPTVLNGSLSQSIYYATNIMGCGAGANIVTVTFSVAAAYPDIRILEYNGINANNPVDVSVANSGRSRSGKSGSVTTTNADDLLFAADIVGTFTAKAGAGFTARTITLPDGDIVEDRTVTATGNYSATVPLDKNGPWIMQLIAFRAAQ